MLQKDVQDKLEFEVFFGAKRWREDFKTDLSILLEGCLNAKEADVIRMNYRIGEYRNNYTLDVFFMSKKLDMSIPEVREFKIKCIDKMYEFAPIKKLVLSETERKANIASNLKRRSNKIEQVSPDAIPVKILIDNIESITHGLSLNPESQLHVEKLGYHMKENMKDRKYLVPEGLATIYRTTVLTKLNNEEQNEVRKSRSKILENICGENEKFYRRVMNS